VSSVAVSICSEENPCKNGGRCVDVATEELRDVRVKSRQLDVRKYYVSRCVCRYGFSGPLCQHGKSPSRIAVNLAGIRWDAQADPEGLRPIRTTRTYGPYIGPYSRPICTGVFFHTRMYGPYVRVSKNVPVHTALYIRAVCTGAFFDTRAYGP